MAGGESLEAALEEMMDILPIGFDLTLGLKRIDGALIVHAAIHTPDDEARVVFEEVSSTPGGAVRKLRAHLKDPPGEGR